MRIVNLVENTEGDSGCRAEHGLCFYIETKRHKILMDTGQTDLLLENAKKLSVDLSGVDTVILSHGHYDHSGGIVPFSGINNHAKIYVKKDAFGDYYSMSHGPEPKFIGIDSGINELPGLCLIDGTVEIDEELTVFAGIGKNKPWPLTNSLLLKKEAGEMTSDDFTHEQCLRIKQDDKTYLFSGCAHHGILNVLDRYQEIYGCNPDYVISGMHTMRKTGYTEDDISYIKKTAHEMAKTDIKFYTCHCTGVEPFEMMQEIMGEQIHYVHCGDEINI
ncbi:MAG: MBL fold metallo-hydrolase [Pseudobutyrivibrio sp.]|nr:MBL fold metallo-hydrolase [Pseudobutyrivibrio sp.]